MTRAPVAPLAAGRLTVGLAIGLASALTLSGCIAAAVPVIAGAAIGGKKLTDGKRPPRAASSASIQEKHIMPALPPGTRLTLLPAGSMLPAPRTAPLAQPPARDEGGWRGLVRHVARAMSEDKSCLERTPGVLIDARVATADAAERDTAVSSIDALYTMGASVTFIADDPVAARRALASAGLAGRAVSVVTPGEVASIVRHGCVVASGGGARATFTGLAWFDLPGGAGTSLPAGVVRP